MERRRMAGRVPAAAVGSVMAGLLAACSATETAVPSSVSVEETAAVTDEDDLFTERDGTSPADDRVDDQNDPVDSIDEPDEPVEPVEESLAPVAETGVPGIESDDDFCRSWSRYAGSVQAISLAWALQAAPAAARLEVAATAALSDAVADMAADLPDEIEANRQALTVDVPGPFLRRADRARALLIQEGIAEDEIDALGDAWVEAITAQGVESDDLSVDIPPGMQAAVDAASQMFASELPPVNEDPTLDTTEYDIGPSLDYISVNCPDQGTLAGNDMVDAGGT